MFGLLCILVDVTASAQEFSVGEQSRLSIALQGGQSVTTAFGPQVDRQLEPYLSYAGFMTDPVLHEHKRITFSATCKLELSRLVFAKGGLGFLAKGTRIDYGPLLYPVDVKNRYLTFPLLIGISRQNHFSRRRPFAPCMLGSTDKILALKNGLLTSYGYRPRRNCLQEIFMLVCSYLVEIIVFYIAHPKKKTVGYDFVKRFCYV